MKRKRCVFEHIPNEDSRLNKQILHSDAANNEKFINDSLRITLDRSLADAMRMLEETTSTMENKESKESKHENSNHTLQKEDRTLSDLFMQEKFPNRLIQCEPSKPSFTIEQILKDSILLPFSKVSRIKLALNDYSLKLNDLVDYVVQNIADLDLELIYEFHERNIVPLPSLFFQKDTYSSNSNNLGITSNDTQPLDMIIQKLCHVEDQTTILKYMSQLPLQNKRIAKCIHQWKVNGRCTTEENNERMILLHIELLKMHKCFHVDFISFLTYPNENAEQFLNVDTCKFFQNASHCDSLLKNLMSIYLSNVQNPWDDIKKIMSESKFCMRSLIAITTFLNNKEKLKELVIFIEEIALQHKIPNLMISTLVLQRNIQDRHEYTNYISSLLRKYENNVFVHSVLHSIIQKDTTYFCKLHLRSTSTDITENVSKRLKLYSSKLFEKVNEPPVGQEKSFSYLKLSENRDIKAELKQFAANESNYLMNSIEKDYTYNYHGFITYFLPKLLTYVGESDEERTTLRKLVSVLIDRNFIPESILNSEILQSIGTHGPSNTFSNLSLTNISMRDSTTSSYSLRSPRSPKSPNIHDNRDIKQLEVKLLNDFDNLSRQFIEKSKSNDVSFGDLLTKLNDTSSALNTHINTSLKPLIIQVILTCFMGISKGPPSLLTNLIPCVESYAKHTLVNLPSCVELLGVTLKKLIVNISNDVLVVNCCCNLVIIFMKLKHSLPDALSLFDSILLQSIQNVASFMRNVNIIMNLCQENNISKEDIPSRMIQLMEILVKRYSYFVLSKRNKNQSTNTINNCISIIENQILFWNRISALHKWSDIEEMLPLENWIQLELELEDSNIELYTQFQMEEYIHFNLKWYFDKVDSSCIHDKFEKLILSSYFFRTLTRKNIFCDTVIRSFIQENILQGQVHLNPQKFLLSLLLQNRKFFEGNTSSVIYRSLSDLFSSFNAIHTSSLLNICEFQDTEEVTRSTMQFCNFASSVLSCIEKWPQSVIQFYVDYFLLLEQHDFELAQSFHSICPIISTQIVSNWEYWSIYIDKRSKMIAKANMEIQIFMPKIWKSLHEVLFHSFSMVIDESSIITFKALVTNYPTLFAFIFTFRLLHLMTNPSGFQALRNNFFLPSDGQWNTFIHSRTIYLLAIVLETSHISEQATLFLSYLFALSFQLSLPLIISDFIPYSPYEGLKNRVVKLAIQRLFDEIQTLILDRSPILLLLVKNELEKQPQKWQDILPTIVSKTVCNSFGKLYYQAKTYFWNIDIKPSLLNYPKCAKTTAEENKIQSTNEGDLTENFEGENMEIQPRQLCGISVDDIVLVQLFKIVSFNMRKDAEWDQKLPAKVRSSYQMLQKLFQTIEFL